VHLAQGSDLIDAGTDVGLPYLGNGPDLGSFEFDPSNGIGDEGDSPKRFALLQNYPNPFNPNTTIRYTLTSYSPLPGEEGMGVRVVLKVFDVLGREVATLVDEVKQPGSYTVQWSVKGGSASGGDALELASGVYFYQLRAGAFSETRKLVVVR
jgi:hypothetical protein